MQNSYLDSLKDWFDKSSNENMETFLKFLRFPSISTDPAYKDDMLACADWVVDFCKGFGFESELIETLSYPVVFAKKHISDDYPTLLIYGHYDVQPADPVELWKSDPFEPRIDGNNIYARGALDNKGQIFYVLLLFKALYELNIMPFVNIKLCIEGEEESASKGLSEILTNQSKLEKLACDYLMVVDLDIPNKDTPAITLGARGIVPMNIELIGSDIDLHSGQHGGIVYNPIRALTEVLAKIWDKNGVIAIPGFYDDVEDYSQDELKEFDLSFDENSYKKSFGIRAFAPEGNRSVLESNWLRPSIEINGIYGGYTKAGFKTVIPAVAHAKLSCRLVLNQFPEKVGAKISKFLSDNIPKGMELKVDVMHGGMPIKADVNSLITKCALNAYSEVFKVPCKKIMAGGSIPVIAEMKNALKCDCVLMGMGLADDNIHAPNEHFSWDRLEKGFYVVGMIVNLMKEYILTKK